MSRFIVLHSGQKVADTQLESGRTYRVGRGSTCDIVLPSERGVSREHFLLEQENGVWTMRLLSKYGEIISQGNTTQQVVLQGHMQLSVPPFEIVFEELAESANQTKAKDENAVANANEPSKLSLTALPTQRVEFVPADEENAAANENPAPNVEAAQDTAGLPMLQENTTDNIDKTQVAQSSIVPYLTIRNGKTLTEEVLRLEGSSWQCGRQKNSEIYINDPAISREHFEISFENNSYFIRDCGSSNGTKLNGEKMESNAKLQIQSGDVLAIRHIEILFEIRNLNIEKMLQTLPQSDPRQNAMAGAMLETSGDSRSPAVIRVDRPSKSGHIVQKLFANKVRAAIVIIAALGVIFALSGGDEENSNQSSETPGQMTESKPSVLSDEQQTRVRDAFNLAKNHYNLQKYELCLSQLEIVHGITPIYETSKELESLCRQGRETQQYVLDQQRREEQKMEVVNKINEVVTDCRQRVTPNTTVTEIEECLAPAAELDPQNELIVQLRTEVESNEIAKNAKEQSAMEFARRRNEGRNLYERASKTYQSGNLKIALQQFQSFVKGNYPGLNQEVDAAKRNISSINNAIETEVNAQLKVCESAIQNTQYKTAYLACSKVLKEYPNNAQAKEIRQKSLTLMNKQLKEIYDNAVVEESYGSIDSAKKKWQEIVENSVPQSEFNSKAKSKLKKYGF